MCFFYPYIRNRDNFQYNGTIFTLVLSLWYTFCLLTRWYTLRARIFQKFQSYVQKNARKLGNNCKIYEKRVFNKIEMFLSFLIQQLTTRLEIFTHFEHGCMIHVSKNFG